METTTLIRKHIASLSHQALFTTRDFLCYGKRSAVDNALSSMVKAGEINRIVRGVFANPKRTKPVSVLEVATIKAQSFGRRIITHAANIAGKLGLLSESNSENYFATDGRTSSFRFGLIVIHFKGTSLRRMIIGDSPAGQAVRTICYLGKNRFSTEIVELVTRELKESERTEIGLLCSFMPAWLSSFFYSWYKPVLKTIGECGITDYRSFEQRQQKDYRSGDLSVQEPTLASLCEGYSSRIFTMFDYTKAKQENLFFH